MCAKFCPIIKENVTYMFCEDCDERICENGKRITKTFPSTLYTYGDVVLFHTSRIVDWNGKEIEEEKDREGIIEIVDAYGTFGQNDEPSYDIFVKETNTLYKHIRQSNVVKKIRVAREEERLK